MAGLSGQNAPPKRNPLLIPLIVVVVVAAVLGGFAALFYNDLVGIAQCDGGLAPGGPACAVDPLNLEQLGQIRLVNGTYSASILVIPGSQTALYSNDLTVFEWNDSGRSVSLLSVTLSATWGRVLANYTVSGANWTTTQSVDIYWPDVFTVTSSTPLVGQIVSVADPSDTQFGPFPCLLS
jgi:hypothetical protein